MFTSRPVRLASVLAALTVVFSMAAIDTAEARRGGSFGTRGTRTLQAPPATTTAPNQVTPVQRSMTPAPATNPGAAANTTGAAARNGGLFGGFGGALLGGLFLGGLFGMMFGGGFGGMGGLLAMLFQVLLIGGVIWLAVRFLRPRTATAGGPRLGNANPYMGRSDEPARPMGGGGSGGAGAGRGGPAPRGGGKPSDTIGITSADLDRFEQMLGEVQAAYSREDFGKLRSLTTPEVLSYLSEELATNASRGVRNEVIDVKLLQGDIAEAWREGNVDWATVALRYSSVDITRDKTTGEVVEGDEDVATEATELWTFTRPRGSSEWKLSAIQEA